jgi:hypothetical protein
LRQLPAALQQPELDAMDRHDAAASAQLSLALFNIETSQDKCA